MSTQPVEIDFLLRDRASQALSNIGEETIQSGRDVDQLMSAISALEAQLEQLRDAPNIDLDQSENIESVRKLEAKIQELREQLANLSSMSEPEIPMPNEQAINHTKRSVNGLHYSIQQVAREMPALSVGIPFFFNAISNNLPILADEIKRARTEYLALKSAGEHAQPVWKQVLSSMFSWQTALTLGITLLVVYGKELVNWTRELFGAGKALQELEQAQKRSIEINRSAAEQVAKSRAGIVDSINEIRRLNGTKEDERRIIDKLNSQYGSTFGYMSTLSEWYNTLTHKAQEYTRAIFLQHKQQKLIEDNVKLEGDLEEMRRKDPEDLEGAMGMFRRVSMFIAQGQDPSFHARKTIDLVNAQNKIEKISELQEKIKKNNFQIQEISQEAARLRASYNPEETLKGSLKELDGRLALSRREYEIATTDGKRAEIQLRINRLMAERKRIEIKTPNAKRADQIKREEKDLAKAKIQARLDGEHLLIEATEKAYERQRKMAALDHKRKVEQINLTERDLLDKQAALRKKGVKIPLSSDLEIKLQADQDRINAELRYRKEISEINEKEAKDNKEKLEKQIKSYRTYQQERLKIEQDYQEALKALRLHGYDNPENAAEAARVRDEAYEALDRRIAEREVGFKALMSRVAKMGMQQIVSLLEEAKTALSIAEQRGDTGKEVAILRAKVTALQAELKAAQIEKELDEKDPIKRWDRALRSLTKIKGALSEAVQGLEGLDEASKASIKSALNVADGVISVIDGVKSLAMASITQLKALEKASIILTIAATAYNILSSLFSSGGEAERKQQEILQQVQLARIKYQQEYNKLLAEQMLLYKQGQSVFGVQEIKKAMEALKVQRQAMQEYQQALQGNAPSSIVEDDFENPEDYIRHARLYKEAMEQFQDGVQGLRSVRIVTGSVTTGWLWWKETKEVYSSLLEVYPKLINANNEIDKQSLKAIIANERMSQSDKARLEGLLASLEAAEKAKEQFDEYLKDTFGALGGNIVSAITNSVREGRDALELFAKDIGGVFEKLGEQLLYSLFFASAFKRLQDDMKKIFENENGLSEEAVVAKATGLLDEFFRSQKKNIHRGKTFAEEYRKKAAEMGYSVFDSHRDQSQNPRAGAFTTMTQDQASKLEGMFTAGQVHWSNIDAAITDLLARSNDWGALLGRIAKNTDYIELIYNAITLMRNEGIKVK